MLLKSENNVQIWHTLQAADHGTKYKPGLVNTINSDVWRLGNVSKHVPLLDYSTTYLFTEKGQVRWTGKKDKCKVNNCLVNPVLILLLSRSMIQYFVFVPHIRLIFGNHTRNCLLVLEVIIWWTLTPMIGRFL